MRRDLVVKVILESAVATLGVPLVEDCFNLIGDVLLAFEMLVEARQRNGEVTRTYATVGLPQ
jgi:hypothetical protein